MEVSIAFNQTQAGLDGRESPDLTMGGKPMAVGLCHMSEKTLTDMGGNICTILYCGDGTFAQDPDTNGKRFAAMSRKLNPDVIICGPHFSYGSYGKMATKTAQIIDELTNIPALVIMPEEYGVAIDELKDRVAILKMPKKGGTGLPQNLVIMCEFVLELARKEDVSEVIREHAYQ